ncbi:hypothetical protein KHC23_02680 [Ancylobacter dichloromethanicus]|uniref:Holin-X, holin superfamily III n=1 Tax=Ancylobacter dichloromethanicus TaxID=518825 RepID=A0A9W6J6X9_9HYPH|nr:phage holin family protein [Ancylobacter dichloromethanicus]MBS7552566.1 hypothetical protein [Ancylobacter dichloromethanicus]GLK71926.1 hypothetical protein GCM10017643_20420 [Ancylobacter dichloromethanicus]
MLRLLLSIFGAELRLTVRRAANTALLLAIGGLLVALSVLFFIAATFIVLAERYDALTAALVLGGGTLVVGLIFFLVALLRNRRRPGAFGGYGGYGAFGAAPPVAGVPPAAPPTPSPGLNTTLGIAAGAAIIGLILGRRV